MASSSPPCADGSEGFRFSRDYAARGTNALLWFVLISVTALLLRKLARLFRFWAQGSRIPGPPCPSFFGQSRLISGGGNLTGYLSMVHEKYGPIVRLWLGPTQLLVSVKDPALIKEVLVKAEDKLPLTGRAFRMAFGRSSLFVPSFEKVQKRREYLANHLNGKLLERENAISLKILDCVMNRVDSIMANGILDCRIVSQYMAFCILGSTVFGDAFLAWSKAAIYEELLMMIAKDASFWASYKFPPIWKRGFWKYQRMCTRLKHLTQDFIKQSSQNYYFLAQSGQSCKGTKDIGKVADGDMMAKGLFLEEIEGHLPSKEEPCGNMIGLMFHGCLTTAGLIGSILTRLAMHPEVQEKIYTEILEVSKESSDLDPNAVQKMRYLLATVYESARLLPAGPLLQRCSSKHDLNLRTSITVPAGAILVVPVQLVQMDNSIWGKDACQFNPHRFLSQAVDSGITAAELVDDPMPLTSFTGTSEKGVECERNPVFLSDDTNVHAAFLPFGSGTRACVGQQFAILGISTLFASLLQYCEVRLQPGSENDPKPTMNDCVLQLLPSPKIAFVRRN